MIIWLFWFLVMSKTGCSLKLDSMMNSAFGCRLWSKLYKSLMLPHVHFQNMKQSSWYLFHNLINSVFKVLYFYLYRFSSKARLAYVGAILVPIVVPRVWI